MNVKENLPLIAGIAIPLFTIAIIMSVIYVPHFFVHPKVNFVYTLGSWNTETFMVKESKAVKNSVTNPRHQSKNNKKEKPDIPSLPKIYIHDVAKNSCKEISLEDLEKLTLSDKEISSDGFSVTSGNSTISGFLPQLIIGGSFNACRTMYLKKGTYSKQIKTDQSPNQMSNCSMERFNFVGWIEESTTSNPTK